MDGQDSVQSGALSDEQSEISELPYAFEHVTDECVASWSQTGKQQLVNFGRKAREAKDTITLATVFEEITQSVFKGRIPPTEGGGVVKEIVENTDDEADPNPSTLFLDTLSILTDSDPHHPQLQPFVFSTQISPNLMRQQLDTALLQSLGMIRDTFSRVGIRKQTNLLYRQSNYNLLREESEGYSKLLTELFTTSTNEPPSSHVVEDTFEKVKAMIGAFDMDVGRVLDVTLDVFAAVLVKQYRFFVKFLRASSWWPQADRRRESELVESGLPKWALPGSTGWSTTDEDREEAWRQHERRDSAFWDRVREVGLQAFFEIGRTRVTDADKENEADEPINNDDETRKWIEQTGTFPPKGNRVAAQLLGFKLRFYASGKRDATDVLPDNLIFLAALLIKIGFISLRDLYPHLWRPDESMDVLKEEKLKEKAERERAARPGGGMNALMMAGALPDDTIPSIRRSREPEAANQPVKEQDAMEAAKEEDKDALPEPPDQKIMLLKSLLTIGALPESLYMLGKFPWLLDAYPELPHFLHRIIHHSLGKIADSVKPLADRDTVRTPKRAVQVEGGTASKPTLRLIDPPAHRVLRWAHLDKEDHNDGTDYRYYWDDWVDNVPICHTVDDVLALCDSFINLSGVKIGQDPALLTKLARIGKHSLKEDPSGANRIRWRDLCKRLLVPALSLTKANPGIVNEVFELLRFYPLDVRYNIYAEWYSGQISRLPDISAAFDLARAETKDALKRLSKTNIKPMARTLAKIAYANPGVVIMTAVSQIEAYENLIEVVVECARYFTDLGYDVLTWALINSLGKKGRSRVQQSGLFTSRWLNSLALFAGRVFKRFSSITDPAPVLQYVAEQVRQNNSTDLIILEQLVNSMAGIISDANFNDSQIQAMAGGEILQSQVMLQLLDKRHECKNTALRLMKSLKESNLAAQLLIGIGQERNTCVYKVTDGDNELKLLGNIFDEIHRVLTQYLDMLRSNLDTEEFDSLVPDSAELIGQFGLPPEVAFWFTRPSISWRMAETDRQRKEAEVAKMAEAEKAAQQVDIDRDVEMMDEGEMKENETDVAESSALAGKSENSDSPWHPVLAGLMEKMKTAMPSGSWEIVGLPFFLTFWQLSLYDLHIPRHAYEEEMERQKKKVITISNDRSDVSSAGTQRKEREKKAVNDLNDRILAEYKQHLEAFGSTRIRLIKEKDHWFAGMQLKHGALNMALLEQCFLPRLLLSPIDAFFSFKMLKFLQSSGTPCFRTVGFYDQLFTEHRLTALIFQCTSKEADNFGRFLNEVLRDLSRWHADKAIYEKEAYGIKRDLPGFATSLQHADGKPTRFLNYEDFRRLLYKWHRLLCGSLKACFTSGEYMHIRNAISVLKAVVNHFPAVNWIGRDMHTCVDNLKSNDPRDDVKIPAASLIGDLNRREKKWMLPQQFMIVSLPAQAGNVPMKRTSG